MSASADQTLLILGATGDLTARLLLPGLGELLAAGGLDQLALVGSGRQDFSDDRWRRLVVAAMAAGEAENAGVRDVLAHTRYVSGDVTRSEDLQRLLDACQGQVIIFFALSPEVTMQACRALGRLELAQGIRLVLEKPFGTDVASARELNEMLARLIPEDQVFRVDHYLGMSTVLNILGLRFANRMFESVLNAENVSSVDIVFDESLALEGRAGYYDGAGALVDMIQSHALQVLSLLAMECPSTLGAQDLRDSKAQVLRATRVWGDPVRCSRRARYTAGQVGGRQLPSYVDEDGVVPGRHTETLAEVVFAVDTWRWAGVPFRVRAGKALTALRKEAVITFKHPPWVPTVSAATTGRTGCGSVSSLTSSDWTSTSTAREIPQCWSRRPSVRRSVAGTYRRTARCFEESSKVIRHCPCAGTPPWSAGASLNRCCMPGAATRCRCRSTRRAVPDQTAGVLSAHRNVTGKGNAGSSDLLLRRARRTLRRCTLAAGVTPAIR